MEAVSKRERLDAVMLLALKMENEVMNQKLQEAGKAKDVILLHNLTER